jgi:hypothetical protein
MDARSNPSLSATSLSYAPVAQLDRAPGYEPGGREFESLRARQLIKVLRPSRPLALCYWNDSCLFDGGIAARISSAHQHDGFRPRSRSAG